MLAKSAEIRMSNFIWNDIWQNVRVSNQLIPRCLVNAKRMESTQTAKWIWNATEMRKNASKSNWIESIHSLQPVALTKVTVYSAKMLHLSSHSVARFSLDGFYFIFTVFFFFLTFFFRSKRHFCVERRRERNDINRMQFPLMSTAKSAKAFTLSLFINQSVNRICRRAN